MTVKQVRFDNPSKTNEEFQALIDMSGLIYNAIFYDADNTITIITQDSISNLKSFKQAFRLKPKTNVSRKIYRNSITNIDLVMDKITPVDLS